MIAESTTGQLRLTTHGRDVDRLTAAAVGLFVAACFAWAGAGWAAREVRDNPADVPVTFLVAVAATLTLSGVVFVAAARVCAYAHHLVDHDVAVVVHCLEGMSRRPGVPVSAGGSGGDLSDEVRAYLSGKLDRDRYGPAE